MPSKTADSCIRTGTATPGWPAKSSLTTDGVGEAERDDFLADGGFLGSLTSRDGGPAVQIGRLDLSLSTLLVWSPGAVCQAETCDGQPCEHQSMACWHARSTDWNRDKIQLCLNAVSVSFSGVSQ